jgi:hypothetical protein
MNIIAEMTDRVTEMTSGAQRGRMVLPGWPVTLV